MSRYVYIVTNGSGDRVLSVHASVEEACSAGKIGEYPILIPDRIWRARLPSDPSSWVEMDFPAARKYQTEYRERLDWLRRNGQRVNRANLRSAEMALANLSPDEREALGIE